MTSLRHNDDPAPEKAAAREPRDLHLDAARACLLDVGWRRTTLTEVARRAGVSRMTIYRTWADMPALLGDLMTREWSDVVERALRETDGSQPRITRLVDAVTATVRELRVNELFVRIVELDPELLLPYLLSRRGRSQELILGILLAEIAAGQGAGEIRAGEPVTIARGLVLTAHGFVLSAHTMTDGGVDLADLDAELGVVLTRSLQP